MKALVVLVARRRTWRRMDRLGRIAPLGQPPVAVVFIRVHQTIRLNRRGAEGLERRWLDIRPHLNHDLAVALEQPEHGRFRGGEGATTALALQTTPSARTAPGFHDGGLAFMSGDDRDLVPFNFAAPGHGLFWTRPLPGVGSSSPAPRWAASLVRRRFAEGRDSSP